MAKVYVSSTFLDLEEYRKKVNLVLRRIGHEDVAMEYYVAEDKRPVDKCLDDVADCNLYVGIFAWRYGWIPVKRNRRKLSITEMEYRQAVKHGKTCLIFLLDGKAPWPPDFTDDDKARIRKLRDELAEMHGGDRFRSADELGRIVAEAIYKWEKTQGLIIPRGLHHESDFTAYFTTLKKRYQRLDLDALTPPQKEEYLQLQLRNVFVEQNVRENPPPVELTKEAWTRLHREREVHHEDLPSEDMIGVSLDELRRAREVYYEKPTRPVLEVIANPTHRQIIVLGDPGSGKSTLARYALLSLIDPSGDEKLRRAFDGYMPLLIELRSYAGLRAENKCETFLEFLEFLSQTEGGHLTKDALHHYLKNDGRAVVIFDGLDEIFDPEDRETVARRIIGFADDYPKARIIVTSRVIGYRRKILEDAGFAHFTLQDLDEEQVGKFVNRWYEQALFDRPEEARERRERIMRAFKDSTSIRQLAGNPMLLTIMAIISKHQELPRERWKLYDHAAGVLIEHWDVNKHLRDQNVKVEFIGEDEKKELLRRLAYKMQSGAGGLAGNYTHGAELQAEFEIYLERRFKLQPRETAITARTMINQFRERNFILCLYGANLYGFVHRAFLEFFCASAFVHKFEKTKELTLDQLKQIYSEHWEERSWHEVLRLICGMINEKFAGELIECLRTEPCQPKPKEYKKRPPWNIALAVQCLGELKNLELVAESAKRLLESVFAVFYEPRLFEYSIDFDKFLREQIAAGAETIGSNWPQRGLLVNCLRRYKPFKSSWSYAESFGSFVGSVGAGSNELHQIVLNYTADSDDKLRFLAPFIVAKGWRNDPQTLAILRNQAMQDESATVRHAAAIAIVEHFLEDDGTLPLLHDLAMKDKAANVRSAAVRAVGQHFPNNEWVLSSLRDRAVKDDDEWVRRAAVDAIGEHFRDDERTLPLLRDWAMNAKHSDVRSAAVSAIGRHFYEDEHTLPLLRDRAMNARYKVVRSAAVRVIGEHFHEDGHTLPLLRDWAMNAQHSDVRSTAVWGIGQHFQDDEQTLPLLRDRATNAKHSEVRSAAVSAIGQYFRENEQTLPLLRDRAMKDDNERVRSAAVRAIGRHFQDSSETLSLLRDRAAKDNDHLVRSAAVHVISQHFREDSETLPLLRDLTVKDESADVRSEAVSAIGEYFRDDEHTLPLLRDLAVKDESGDIRRAAVRAIGQNFQEDDHTLPLLHDWAMNAEHSDVRSAAVQTIGRHYREHEQTLPLLRDRVARDNDHLVRSLAVHGIGQYFREDEQTLPLLRDWAMNAQHSDVRSAAVSAIGQYFREDEQTLPLLRDRAVKDESDDVCSTAVSAIGQYFREDEQTLPMLCDQAINAKRGDIRSAAVSAIGNYFRESEQTLPLLRDQAVKDESAEVRRAAVWTIGQHYREDEQTLPLLHDCAINDESPSIDSEKPDRWKYVRQTAIQMIAQYWPTHPDTLPMLLERSKNDPTPWLRERAKELADEIEASR